MSFLVGREGGVGWLGWCWLVWLGACLDGDVRTPWAGLSPVESSRVEAICLEAGCSAPSESKGWRVYVVEGRRLKVGWLDGGVGVWGKLS